jgi:hypothetical protein
MRVRGTRWTARSAAAVVGSMLTAAWLVAACSVVDDGKARRIDPPGELDDTLPTTTTDATTTNVPTSSSAVDSSTTLVQTEPVRLYFIASGQLVYVTTPVTSPVVLPVIIFALQEGPPAETFGLRSAVPRDMAIGVTTDGSGVANVDLPDDFFDVVSRTDQRLVIGQIVLTLTDSRGIGQVVFDQPVTKPLGEIVAAGQPLSYRDYEALAGSVPLPADELDTESTPAGTTTTVSG